MSGRPKEQSVGGFILCVGFNLLIKYICNKYKGRCKTLLLNLCIQMLKLRYINRLYHLMNGLCMYRQGSGELMKNCYN